MKTISNILILITTFITIQIVVLQAVLAELSRTLNQDNEYFYCILKNIDVLIVIDLILLIYLTLSYGFNEKLNRKIVAIIILLQFIYFLSVTYYLGII